jgi:hypothetical protein
MDIIIASIVAIAGLGGEPPAVQAAPPASAEGRSDLAREVADLRKKLEAEAAARLEERKALEERLRKLEEELERRRLEEKAAEEAREAEGETGEKPGGFLGSIGSALNPSLTLIGNAFARVDDKKAYNGEGLRIDDQVNLREAEIDARAAIDPYADGVIIAAFESEAPGEASVGIEEAYATLKSLPFLERPPLGLKLRGGRFRPAFGRINLLHTHDLPQTTRPLAVAEFLGDEGFSANGGSAEFFIPTPWDTEESLDLTLQALSAGEAAVAEEARNDFAYLAHLRWFRVTRDVHTVELGASGYWSPTAPDGTEDVFLGGLDTFYKWKPLRQGEWRSFVLGGELYAADRDFRVADPGAPDGERRAHASPLGAYGMAQYQFGRRLYAGVRGDWTQAIEDDGVERHAVLPYVSYYLSEFLRFRVNYEHLWSDLASDGRDTVYFEMNFVIGAHPPEPFWVNR